MGRATGRAAASGPLQTNSVQSLREAALAGLGIADLPSYLVADPGRATGIGQGSAPGIKVHPGCPVPSRKVNWVSLSLGRISVKDW
jgi:DNA-binding transcriptional LysR family regulator